MVVSTRDHVVLEPARGQRHPDLRVGLVDVGVGVQAQVVLGGDAHVAEAGLAGVTGARVDAGEVDHDPRLGPSATAGGARPCGRCRTTILGPMEGFQVVSRGPLSSPLTGTVPVGGAKNSALKLMAASLLATGRTVVDQRPRHPRRARDGPAARGARLHRGDLDRRGAARPRRRQATGTLRWRSTCPRTSATRRPTTWSAGCARRSACSARWWRAAAAPGWPCPAATTSARAVSTCTSPDCTSSVPRSGSSTGSWSPRCRTRLRGANLWLDFPSVGATENLLMAAVLADGTTVIDNVAREPEISDLCEMLIAMGADIEGVTTSTLTVRGVDSLRPVEHATVPRPDRLRHLGLRGGRRRRRPHGARRPGPSTSTSCSTSWSPPGARSRSDDDGFRVRGRQAAGRLRRGDPAVPGVPHRPAAVRDDAGRGQRRHRDDHRERLRGAVHVRPGARPARGRPAHRRPPRRGPRQAACSRARPSSRTTSAPAPPWCWPASPRRAPPRWPSRTTSTGATRASPRCSAASASTSTRVDLPDLAL